jgi:hypothetical protein
VQAGGSAVYTAPYPSAAMKIHLYCQKGWFANVWEGCIEACKVVERCTEEPVRAAVQRPQDNRRSHK